MVETFHELRSWENGSASGVICSRGEIPSGDFKSLERCGPMFCCSVSDEKNLVRAAGLTGHVSLMPFPDDPILGVLAQV